MGWALEFDGHGASGLRKTKGRGWMAVVVAQYCELLNATELFAWKWSEWSISCHACFTTMIPLAEGGEAGDKELIGEMGPPGTPELAGGSGQGGRSLPRLPEGEGLPGTDEHTTVSHRPLADTLLLHGEHHLRRLSKLNLLRQLLSCTVPLLPPALMSIAATWNCPLMSWQRARTGSTRPGSAISRGQLTTPFRFMTGVSEDPLSHSVPQKGNLGPHERPVREGLGVGGLT